jgi:hypothetical protein
MIKFKKYIMNTQGKEVDIRECIAGKPFPVNGSEFIKESTDEKDDVDVKDATLDENEEVDVNTKTFSINEDRKDGIQLV